MMNLMLKDFFKTGMTLLVAVLLAVGLIFFVFQSYQVDGISMEPTLQNDDRLVVWKLPRTWARVTGHDFTPKLDDIIVFDQPNLSACGQYGERQLIKRVIGLPGDRVVVNAGSLTVYNDAHPLGYKPDTTGEYQTNQPTPNNTDVTIQAGQIFVSGDNRPDSCDSRSFGPIKLSQVVGTLALRLPT